MRRMLPNLLALVIALLILGGCKIQMDLDFKLDGSGSGVVTAKGNDLPDDANGFRNHLAERGFVVSSAESTMSEGERRIVCDVTWPAYAHGVDHPILEKVEDTGEEVSWTLRKDRLETDMPSEVHLSLPGTPHSASGGRIDGQTVIYPGPESARVWTVVFRPGSGVNASIIVAVLAVILIIAAAVWALRQGSKDKTTTPA